MANDWQVGAEIAGPSLFKNLIPTREEMDQRAVDSANINFADRMRAVSLPVQRMLGSDGKLDKQALGNIRPFPGPDTVYASLRDDMPSNKAIDQEQFTQMYDGSKTRYDQNIANQLDFLRNSGVSERKIRKKLAASNPSLLSYGYQNMLVQPKVDGVLDDFLLAVGSYGAVRGAGALHGLSGLPSASKSQISALRKLGFTFKDGQVVRMTEGEILKESYNKPKKPSKKTNKAARKKASANTKRILQGQKNMSATAKQAMKAGSTGRVKNIATNMLLKNVGKHLGGTVGKGLLAGALRVSGLSTPMGWLATGASLLIPYAYRKLKD